MKCEIGEKLKNEYDRILFDVKKYPAFCDAFVDSYRALRDHEKTCPVCVAMTAEDEKKFIRARIVALESELQEMREKLGKDLDLEVENGNKID